MTNDALLELLSFCSHDVTVLSEPGSGIIEAVAGPVQALTGYHAHEIVGRTTIELELFAQQNRADVLEQLQTQGSIRDSTIKITPKHGPPVFVEFSARIVQTESGVRLFAAMRDLAERPAVEGAREVITAFFVADELSVWACNLMTQQVQCYTAAAVSSYAAEDLLVRVHPDDRAHITAMAEALVQGVTRTYEVEFRRPQPGGGVRWIHSRGQLKYNLTGQPTHILGVDVDVTATRTALLAAEHFTDHLLETANVMVVGLDPEARVRIFNRAAEQITGWSRADVLGRSWFETLVPSTRSPEIMEVFIAAASADHRVTEYENPVLTPDGEQRQILWRSSRGTTPQGDPIIMCFGLDVTQQRRIEADAAHLALHDSLTDLPNRQLFLDRLTHERLRQVRDGNRLAVHMIDLDRFKDVNDAYGHPSGDAVLQEVARRLSRTIRAGDTLARLGGDEFAVLQVNANHPEDAARLADRLLTALHPSIDCMGHQLHITTSIGITLCGAACTHPIHEFMRRADPSLYQAKAAGRDRHAIHSEQMSDAFLARIEIMQTLDDAIEHQGLITWFQPQVSLQTVEIIGVEALVRWADGRAAPTPDVFIPMAERSGRIVQLGQVVQECTFATGRRWADAGLLPATLGINVSPVELRDTQYARRTLATLAKHGLPPSAIELEVTETALFEQNDVERNNLLELSQAGVRFAIDDFGTGFSSLRTLEALPTWRLKIDRSFVQDMQTNAAHAEIVRATVGLARVFGQSVIAEGIETPEVRDALLEVDCQLGQGYWYARPLPEADVTALLEAQWLPLPPAAG